jgi:hypothetical protein
MVGFILKWSQKKESHSVHLKLKNSFGLKDE